MYQKNIALKKAVYEKDVRGEKRKNSFREIEYDTCPEFAKTIEQNDIKKLANSLNSSDPNSYLGRLLESNERQPCHFDSLYKDLPSKKMPTESMQLNINDSSVRGKILQHLQHTLDEQPLDSAKSQLNCSVKIASAEVEKNTI